MGYEGFERRKPTMNGKEIVAEIENRIITLETKFEERWVAHDKQAEERQKQTCQKLDDIKDNMAQVKKDLISSDKDTSSLITEIHQKINKLPCEVTLLKLEEIEKIKKDVDKTKTTAGSIIFWGVTGLLSFGILWGALITNVSYNTTKLTNLDSLHLEKYLKQIDINTIKVDKLEDGNKNILNRLNDK